MPKTIVTKQAMVSPVVVLLAGALAGGLGCGAEPTLETALELQGNKLERAMTSRRAGSKAAQAMTQDLRAARIEAVEASDGAAGDEFGVSVALSGDTAIVGARRGDVGASADQGLAYVFKRVDGAWIEEARLEAKDGELGDQFGISVALEGDTAIVGAYYDDVGAKAGQGSAFVFKRAGGAWNQEAQLFASDGDAGDDFGVSVALSGDTALVGAFGDDVEGRADQGSAYVFTRAGGAWNQEAQLTAKDGASSDIFGASVALSGDTALVGARSGDVGGNIDQGSAYVFTRVSGGWTQQQKLASSDGAAGDVFGVSVALSANTALVGASGDDVGESADQGSASVFTRSSGKWIQQQKLTASDGATGDIFGISVALEEDTALVGAWNDDVGGNINQGSARVFARSAGAWTEQAELTTLAMGGAAHSDFGVSVALSEDTALVGALNAVGAKNDTGAAYVFVLGEEEGHQCPEPEGCPTEWPLDSVNCAYANGSAPGSGCALLFGAFAALAALRRKRA